MRLTRRTLLDIIRHAPNIQAAIDNPNDWAAAAVAIIKDKLSAQLIDGITYTRIDDWYSQELFDPEMQSWQDLVIPAPHHLYDGVIFDSGIEYDFVQALEHRDDIKMYIKLPNWFKVDTPIGGYNPDWAIVMDDPDAPPGAAPKPVLYLIIETKGTKDKARLRFRHEQQKVRWGEKAFDQALGVCYDMLDTAADLPGRCRTKTLFTEPTQPNPSPSS